MKNSLRRTSSDCALAVGLVLAGAPATSADELRVPSALICTFKQVISGELSPDGSYAASTLSTEPMQFTFAAIDAKAHTAQLIGNAGAAPVTAAPTDKSINFIERTPSGNIMLTTVMLEDGAVKLGAVHSRHTVMDGAAVVSQYAGACDVRD